MLYVNATVGPFIALLFNMQSGPVGSLSKKQKTEEYYFSKVLQ